MTTITQKSSWLEKTIIGLLSILNILFLAYWVALSLNYCLHYDDVHFMWKMREYSIFEYVREMYFSRGGNFVGYGLNGIIFTLSNWIGDYHAWPIIFYTIGIAMTYAAAKGLIKGLSNWKLFIGTTAIYNIYILTVPDYAVFTWLCAMGYFLFAPSMCLMLRHLNKEKLSICQWCILILIALYLSGTNISITPMMWLLMLVNALYIWKNNNWDFQQTWQNKTIKRIAFTTIFMLIIYIIMFIAPGNFSRLEDGTDMNHPASITQFVIAWVKCNIMFLYFMAFYLPYHLLAVGLGLITGSKSNITINNHLKATIFTILSYTIYIVIATIPLAYLSNGFGIQRNYTHITYFYILTWFALGFIWGTKTHKPTFGRIITLLSTCLLIVIMSINLYTDIPLAKAYNKAHQQREAMLLDLQSKGNKETITVTQYPSTATLDAKYVILKTIGKTTSQQTIYYESDTDTIPNEYESHIKHLLHLDYDFILDKKVK